MSLAEVEAPRQRQDQQLRPLSRISEGQRRSLTRLRINARELSRQEPQAFPRARLGINGRSSFSRLRSCRLKRPISSERPLASKRCETLKVRLKDVEVQCPLKPENRSSTLRRMVGCTIGPSIGVLVYIRTRPRTCGDLRRATNARVRLHVGRPQTRDVKRRGYGNASSPIFESHLKDRAARL